MLITSGALRLVHQAGTGAGRAVLGVLEPPRHGPEAALLLRLKPRAPTVIRARRAPPRSNRSGLGRLVAELPTYRSYLQVPAPTSTAA